MPLHEKKYEFYKVGNTRILTGTKEEARALRKERRAKMSTEEKLTEFFSCTAQICALLCCIGGAIAISRFFLDVLHWNLIIGILPTVLIGISGAGLFMVPAAREEALEKEIKELDYYLGQRDEVILHAVECRDIAALYPLCDPEWLEYTKRTSPYWLSYQKEVEQYQKEKLAQEQARTAAEHESYLDSLSQCTPPE